MTVLNANNFATTGHFYLQSNGTTDWRSFLILLLRIRYSCLF